MLCDLQVEDRFKFLGHSMAWTVIKQLRNKTVCECDDGRLRTLWSNRYVLKI